MAEKEPGARLLLLPRVPEQRQEFRGQQDVPIVLAFALPHPQDHARAVDIRDLHLAQFRHAQPRRRERGEDGPMFQVAWGGQERRDFGLAEDVRQCEGPLRRRDRLQYLWASEGNAVEEAQRADGLDHGSPGHLFVLEEKELRGADLLRAQVRGGSPKMPCEIGDTAEVAVHSEGRVVAELHVFHQALAQGCHGQASHLHAWTPSGQNGDDRSVGVMLLTEESLWSRHMPEARWAQRWRGWEERKALYPNAVSGFVQEGLSEPRGHFR